VSDPATTTGTLATLASGAAVAHGVEAVFQVLDRFNAARSCILEIDNNTNLTLGKVSDEHSHGGFAVTPTFQIPPKTALIFGSQSKGFATGTVGSVVYNGGGIGLVVSWDNPFVGDNSCNMVLSGPNAVKFRVIHTCGVGNKEAHNRYELIERIPPNFNQTFIGNPVLIQSRFGNQGNFELLVPLGNGGLAAYWRDNDSSGLPWEGPVIFGQGQRFDAVTMIQSNFGNPGNFEVIARSGDRLFFFFRDEALNWNGPFLLQINGVDINGGLGNPVLIQSRFGNQGNFELVVPRTDTGFDNYFRNNDDPQFPWIQLPSAGIGQIHIDSISLIQSNFGTTMDVNGNTLGGNFEVIARSGDRLFFFFRDSEWHGPFPIKLNVNGVDTDLAVIFAGIAGNPALIQSRFGNQGNFELITPQHGFLSGGSLIHLFRNNDDPQFPWASITKFGDSNYDAVTMIQSNFGNPGNFEVIARSGDRLFFFVRDSSGFHGPFLLI